MKKLFFLLIITLIFSACEISPQAINYGNEACEYCNMTIVDQQYASQLVNKNGKAYNFDAIECMIHYSEDIKEKEYQLYLINDFKNPGTLIDAKTAYYLISPEISSPMGANLSGFASEEDAKKAESNYDGQLYNWANITKEISK
ncbi:nitrous oxide reductase accessory protein NosL [Christiangramia forsetii]|uniref:Nitrous-oxide reductase accessory protein NosL n=2 Tax=Christiangramia forsetii TaxID=411153 RepID=A0M188_CHRFK|nr:nitrous oxide reductase accessory protein NosL [Christiangramia forsetii]GGG43097.1 hypothetical protein GCM10011532_28810 [Christiangramia forsetii]CAL66383.1 nitrous-oxide reductase accessory protein NosL [Christiangramia forsetii KT0803]